MVPAILGFPNVSLFDFVLPLTLLIFCIVHDKQQVTFLQSFLQVQIPVLTVLPVSDEQMVDECGGFCRTYLTAEIIVLQLGL
jgi:hypothetical protein